MVAYMILFVFTHQRAIIFDEFDLASTFDEFDIDFGTQIYDCSPEVLKKGATGRVLRMRAAGSAHSAGPTMRTTFGPYLYDCFRFTVPLCLS